MDLFNCLGIGDHQVIVATGGAFTAKMLWGQVLPVKIGTHRAIKQQNALINGIQVSPVGQLAGFSSHRSSFFPIINLTRLLKH